MLAPLGQKGDTLVFNKWVPVRKVLTFGDDGSSAAPVKGKLHAIQHAIRSDNSAGNSNYTVGDMFYRIFYKDA